jgi:hypothetical protein
MDVRRNLKQTYKSLLNKALEQSKDELKATIQTLGSRGQLVTDLATYEKLAAAAERTQQLSKDRLLSILILEHGLFAYYNESDMLKKVRTATVFYAAKGLTNIWIYNDPLKFPIDINLIKKIFNAKRLELALQSFKPDLFSYDVDEITNPHADFTDFYFHQQIDAALQDYINRSKDLSPEKSAVKISQLQFLLSEAKNAVQATISHQTISEAAPSELRM